VPETRDPKFRGGQAVTMRKINLTNEMVQRIEDALDERKVQRRARAQPGAPGERRYRPDRRAAVATDGTDAQPAAAPADPLTDGRSAPG
jgi:hypothetical protein